MEDLIPLLLLVFWGILGWLSRKVKKRGERGEEPSALEQFLQQMAEEGGLVQEQPPPQQTQPQPRRVQRQVIVPPIPVPGSEHRVTSSEHQPSVSEHRPTASEHVAGDVVVPGIPRERPGRARRRRSKLGLAIASGLRAGGLSRAVMLREILGPPVGLRSPEEQP